MYLPWIICCMLSVTVIAITVKLITVKVSLMRITKRLKDIILDDTNIMITVSTRDKGILRFANALNEQLISLRVLRQNTRAATVSLRKLLQTFLTISGLLLPQFADMQSFFRKRSSAIMRSDTSV